MGLLFSQSDNSVKINHPQKVIHEEKRAPTDMSIQLAKEYEELIEKKICERLMVQGNIVNFSLAIQDDMMGPKFHIKMRINENDFTETFSIINPDMNNLIDRLTKWMCEKIILEPIREIAIAYLSGRQNYRFIGIEEKDE